MIALGACGLGLAALAAAGSGDGAGPTSDRIAAGYAVHRIAGAELEPASGPQVAVLRAPAPSTASANGKPKKKRRAGLRLKYYIGVDFQAVPPGGAQLFEIRCPTRGEQPLTGGMFAPLPGLVAVNSSQTNPQPGFPSRPRAWYQAVVNLQATALQWKPFVTCGAPK